MTTSAEQTALGATDPDRLMHGEDPETHSPTQIAFWIAAYGELLTFKGQLLADVEVRLEGVSTAAADEIRELDVAMLEVQRNRYRKRLSFWEARREELALVDEPNGRLS